MSAPEFKLKLARAARSDLASLLSFTLQTWGRAQFLAYQEKLNAALAAIAANPRAGKPRHGLLVHQVGRHRIFYRVEDTVIIVLRILHDRMDAGRHLP